MAKSSVGYWVYRLFSRVYPVLIGLAAQLGHQKAKLWLQGRNDDLWDVLKRGRSTLPGRVAWFHVASLGEFEQARPVMEAFKIAHPGWGIVLTFFSPSGYTIRKNYQGADVVTYLPSDSPENAPRFLDIVRPDLALFVKYEFWPFYLLELQARNIPAISFSAIFRPGQVFFRPWGRFMRRVLSTFSRIYTQDERSVRLLHKIRMPHAEQAGDTRFDRVIQIAQQAQKLPLIATFKGKHKLVVLGSAWPKDELVLLEAIKQLPAGLRPKLVVAPHELDPNHLDRLTAWEGFRATRYSTTNHEEVAQADLLIIDNIGMLSSIYHYADIAWVGGAFGSGLHNILEAAVYGIPVMFGGPNYKKFQEAKSLIKLGAGQSLTTPEAVASALHKLLGSEQKRAQLGQKAADYCHQNAGATEKVMLGIKALIGTL